MRNIFKSTFCFLFISGIAFSGVAQDDGFIYGKITTIDDKSFEGPIRWGKEEVFWTDMFNVAKEENNNLSYLNREQREKLEERHHWNNGFVHWVSAKVNYYRSDGYDHTHQFVCQFGDIKSIRPTGRSSVEVTLQNGDKFEFRGEGYNDIGTDVKIIDPEIGEIQFDWGRIEKIEFNSTPKLPAKFGEPLYGTVETYAGTFTGYVQWDHDERLTTDKLDGDTDDGDLSIDFGNIKSIEREGYSASQVVLKSGRDVELRGSNDVNSENRGIIVTSDKFGRIDIPWDEFKKVTFEEKASGKLRSYGDFGSQKKLEGTVVTRSGESHKGRIIYDLDEESNYEVLQGKSNDIEYIIAFGDIKTITPKNYDFSDVELKNGEKILIGEGQDVSDKNTGILIFAGSGDPVYVSWEDVKEINFN